MKVAVASDHAGPDQKAALVADLRQKGHEVIDFGPAGTASVDYPDFAAKVARAVASGEADAGVLVCGTGIGMSMSANKVHGVRAAVAHDDFTAQMARAHNDANVLCVGARVLTVEEILNLTQVFLETPFEGGRHAQRVEKIMALEKDPA